MICLQGSHASPCFFFRQSISTFDALVSVALSCFPLLAPTTTPSALPLHTLGLEANASVLWLSSCSRIQSPRHLACSGEPGLPIWTRMPPCPWQTIVLRDGSAGR